MHFQPHAQKSHMLSIGWYKDKSGKFESETNSGFKSRSELIKDSKPFELMGPLFLDLLQQERYLISQTDVRLKLLPSKPEFALNSYGTATFEIEFMDVILYVPRAELNPSVINGHSTGMRQQNAIYPVLHSEIITFAIPKRQKSYSKDRLFPDQALSWL